VINEHQECLSGKTASIFIEFRSQCKDGSWKWVLSRGAVVSRSADGKALRMIGTHVDISKQKLTQEALLVASRFQQAVFDSLTAQIAVLDQTGTVVQTNAAWRQYAVDSVRVEPVQVNGHLIAYTVSIGAGCLSSETSLAAH